MGNAMPFNALLTRSESLLALAPMQDVTDLPFWRLMCRYGGADVYYTEYFRVHPTYTLHKDILRSITENPTGKPVVAQMIGNDLPSLVRSARELENYDVAGIDLNLGCPAPVVYRKCAGGGLLRDLPLVDRILGGLRETITTRFSVKTRIGFDSPDRFSELLALFRKHDVDLVAVHGRTVAEMYRSEVHYDLIAQAVRVLKCPVLANGNVYSAEKGLEVLRLTGARGIMIGRGAIRNPWIFHQFRQLERGEPMYVPRGCDVLQYLERLYEETRWPSGAETAHVQKMKKYLNYIGLGIEPTGRFLHEARRVTTRNELFSLAGSFLDHDRPMPLEPFALNLKPSDLLAGEHL